MKRILVDCRFASLPVGLGRFTQGLMHELVQQQHIHCVLLAAKDDPCTWLPSEENYTIVRTNIAYYSVVEQLILPFYTLYYRCSAYCSLHFNAPILVPVPLYVVIHDLILHRYPNAAGKLKQWVYRSLLYLNTFRAKRIVAVSKATATDIAEYYGKRIAKKVTHITEGIESIFTPATDVQVASTLQQLHIQKPFILFVGNAKEHKNVPALIQGFLQSTLSTSHTLVLVCADESLQEEYQNEPRIEFIIHPNTVDLISLYTAAKAFITASLYEGFCLPILEARACKTAVIAPESPAIKELLDPEHDSIIIEPTIAGIANGLNALDSFTWQESQKGMTSWQTVASAYGTLFTNG